MKRSQTTSRPAVLGRLDHPHRQLGPGGAEQEQLGPRVERQTGVLQQVADPLAHVGAARLAQAHACRGRARWRAAPPASSCPSGLCPRGSRTRRRARYSAGGVDSRELPQEEPERLALLLVERRQELVGVVERELRALARVRLPFAVRCTACLRRSDGWTRRSARPSASSWSSTATIELGSISEPATSSRCVRPGRESIRREDAEDRRAQVDLPKHLREPLRRCAGRSTRAGSPTALARGSGGGSSKRIYRNSTPNQSFVIQTNL